MPRASPSVLSETGAQRGRPHLPAAVRRFSNTCSPCSGRGRDGSRDGAGGRAGTEQRHRERAAAGGCGGSAAGAPADPRPVTTHSTGARRASPPAAPTDQASSGAQMVQLPARRLVLLRTILRSVATTERTAPLAVAGGRRAFTYAGVLRRSLAGRPMTSVQIHRRNNPSANDGQDNGDQCDERAEDHVVQMPALHRVLRRRQAPRDLRPRLLQLAPEEGDALLEHALVLLEAQDLGAQPPELAAQGVDVGDVVLEATSSSISAVGRLRAAVLRRTVIFSWAAQYFSRAVPGSPGRWTRARTSCPFLNVTGRDTTSHSWSSSPASVSVKRSPMWIWPGKIDTVGLRVGDDEQRVGLALDAMGRRLPGVDVPGVDAMEVDPLEDSVQKSLTTRRSGGVEVHRGGDRAADRRLLDGEDTHRGPRVEGGRRLGVDGQVPGPAAGQDGVAA